MIQYSTQKICACGGKSGLKCGPGQRCSFTSSLYSSPLTARNTSANATVIIRKRKSRLRLFSRAAWTASAIVKLLVKRIAVFTVKKSTIVWWLASAKACGLFKRKTKKQKNNTPKKKTTKTRNTHKPSETASFC